MKPKSMFYDEKNSAASFWNNRSIIRWNRDRIQNAKCNMSLQTFVKIVILIIFFIFFGVILLSWLSQPSRVEQPNHRLQESSHQQTSSSSFPPSTTITIKQKSSSSPSPQWTEESIGIKLQKIAELDSSTTSSSTTNAPTQTSSTTANTISNFDDHTTEKSSYNAADDAALLTKKYVRLNSLVISINFSRMGLGRLVGRFFSLQSTAA